jgi:hypothetical protein
MATLPALLMNCPFGRPLELTATQRLSSASSYFESTFAVEEQENDDYIMDIHDEREVISDVDMEKGTEAEYLEDQMQEDTENDDSGDDMLVDSDDDASGPTAMQGIKPTATAMLPPRPHRITVLPNRMWVLPPVSGPRRFCLPGAECRDPSSSDAAEVSVSQLSTKNSHQPSPYQNQADIHSESNIGPTVSRHPTANQTVRPMSLESLIKVYANHPQTHEFAVKGK